MAWQPFLYVIDGSLSDELPAPQVRANAAEAGEINAVPGSQSNTPAEPPADTARPGSRATFRQSP